MLISSKCLGRSALRRSHAVAELLVCAVLVLVGPAVAAAQEAPVQTAQNAPDPGAIDQLAEVVVTAQFRQESAQVAPLAITAINAQMLEDRNQTSVIDIANQAPNVTLKPANQSLGGGSSLVASIRGIGQSDFDPALEPGVGMYVDDVYYGNLTGSILDLLDLDRVEVLRGPQGTLAGKNSIGGAIKLYSQQPTGDTSDSVEVLYGSRNHLEVRGSADFAILPDTLFARISGVANHQDGYVNVLDFGCANPSLGLGATSYNSHIGSCQQGQEGGLSYDGGRISLRWVPNDRLQATLIGDVTHDTSESPPNVLLYANNAVNPGSPLSASNPANPNIPTFQGLPFNSALVPQLVPSNRYTSYATYSMPPGVACEGPVPCGLGIPGAMTVPTRPTR